MHIPLTNESKINPPFKPIQEIVQHSGDVY